MQVHLIVKAFRGVGEEFSLRTWPEDQRGNALAPHRAERHCASLCARSGGSSAVSSVYPRGHADKQTGARGNSSGSSFSSCPSLLRGFEERNDSSLRSWAVKIPKRLLYGQRCLHAAFKGTSNIHNWLIYTIIYCIKYNTKYVLCSDLRWMSAETATVHLTKVGVYIFFF